MRILVLLKLVIDPEIPQSKFKIDFENKNQVVDDNPIVISTYDENALEVALKLKDKHNFEVNVFSITPYDYQQPIKKALAMGADKAFVLKVPNSFIDSINLAKLIYDYIKQEDYNLILTGYESADWGHRSIPPVISSLLDYKLITYSYSVEYEQNNWIIRKLVGNGFVVLKTNKNLVVSITTHQENQPRYPKVKDIMMASKKPIIVDEINPNFESNLIIEKIEQPKIKKECQFIDGKDAHEKAQKLYNKLKELKLV